MHNYFEILAETEIHILTDQGPQSVKATTRGKEPGKFQKPKITHQTHTDITSIPTFTLQTLKAEPRTQKHIQQTCSYWK